MALSARELVVRRDRFRLVVESLDADASGTAVLGRNGAGKSTLLLALQNLVPHAGTVERREPCAGVFAQPAVLRGSVVWNVEAIVRAARRSGASITSQTSPEKALQSVGLGAKLDLDARRLSSGERQRLVLARALALQPQTLFLDEPFANVDADGRPALRNVVRDYVARSGCTLLLATQSLADVVALCKRIVVLDDGQVVETIDTATRECSAEPYVRALVAEARIP